MSVIVTTIASILVFSIVILIHELGHYITARRCGIQVNEFSLGMGPLVLQKTRKGIRYSVRALPIGGYVSMEGETGRDEENRESKPEEQAETPPEKSSGVPFNHAPVHKRLTVIVAGACMNFLLGFVIWLLLVSTQTIGGMNVIISKQIAEFSENASTQASGLQVGDEILSINGRRCYVYYDINYEISRAENYTADFVVRRNGEKVTVPQVRFTTKEQENGEISIVRDFKVYAVKKTVRTVLEESLNGTLYYARLIVQSLMDIGRGRVSVQELSGPVGIVSAINTAAVYGWRNLLSLMALITINLGVFNLLPLPALDGGRAVLLLVEGVTGKPVPARVENFINAAGMAMLMGLMLFVTFQDVTRMF